jgi:hypothetical protein
MALKNYRSRPTTNPFEAIQKTLALHKAKQIMLDYGDDGRIQTITFTLQIPDRHYGFRLPARVENVERLLYGTKELTSVQKQQAYATAWANIRDWISAQMALIDTGMVKFEEVFLPYMLDRSGKTYFETLEPKHFLLDSGTPEEEEVISV